MEEPGRLQSMGSLGIRHDWAASLSLFTFMHWRKKWQPTPVFLPGESQGRRSLVGCRLWGGTESDTTEATLQQEGKCYCLVRIWGWQRTQCENSKHELDKHEFPPELSPCRCSTLSLNTPSSMYRSVPLRILLHIIYGICLFINEEWSWLSKNKSRQSIIY